MAAEEQQHVKAAGIPEAVFVVRGVGDLLSVMIVGMSRKMWRHSCNSQRTRPPRQF